MLQSVISQKQRKKKSLEAPYLSKQSYCSSYLENCENFILPSISTNEQTAFYEKKIIRVGKNKVFNAKLLNIND